jgi:four helix bundle protein
MAEGVMARRRGYQELVVWQKAMDLVDRVYDATEEWPRHEQFDLISQTRRAVVSVPANIAEGQGRTGSREFLHHLSIAYGSLNEVETLLQVGQRRRYLSSTTLDSILNVCDDVGRLSLAMISKLQESAPQSGSSRRASPPQRRPND